MPSKSQVIHVLKHKVYFLDYIMYPMTTLSRYRRTVNMLLNVTKQYLVTSESSNCFHEILSHKFLFIRK